MCILNWFKPSLINILGEYLTGIFFSLSLYIYRERCYCLLNINWGGRRGEQPRHPQFEEKGEGEIQSTWIEKLCKRDHGRNE